MEKSGKKKKKKNFHPVQMQRFIATIHTYTYTPTRKIKRVQEKQGAIDQPVKHRKPKIISTKRIVTKAQIGKQNQSMLPTE